MSELFIGVLNLSLKASWLILAVIFLRWVFCRAQKRLTCFLWLLCGIRLAVPFSFESVLSLVPSARTVPPEIVTAEIPQIHSGIAALNSAVNPVLSQNFTAAESGSNALQTVVAVSAAVWLAVTLALVIYGAVSYAALVGKMSDAVLLRNNIFQSEKAPTPFILGFVRPKIYIPYGLSAEDESSVTAHENAHITRRDHIIKPLWYLLLCVHWFNPLVWIAYTLLCRDIELACDEMAVRGMNEEKRKMYAVALLHCAADGKRIAACPLAFGEAGIKERVKSVMNYKKPAFWIVLAAVLASVAVAVGFLTDPVIVPADAGKNFICTDSGTDNENVGFSLGNVEFSDGILKITTYFDNQTESDMTFGEEFHLYYTGKGEARRKNALRPQELLLE